MEKVFTNVSNLQPESTDKDAHPLSTDARLDELSRNSMSLADPEK